MDGISGLKSVVQSFQDQDARPFAHHQAVAARIERGTDAAGRKGTKLAEADLRIQAVGPGYAAGQHGVRPKGPQFVAGQFYGINRGGAGRIQGVGPPPQSQCPGQQGRGQADRSCGQTRVAVHRVQTARYRIARQGGFENQAPGAPRQSGCRIRGQGDGRQYDTDVCRIEGTGRTASIGRPPGGQGQVMQRIEGTEQVAVQIETLWIERYIVDQAAPAGIRFVRSGLGVEHGIRRDDPPVRGHMGGGIHLVGDVVPECFQIGCSGKQPGHADHGDRCLVLHGAPGSCHNRTGSMDRFG